MVLACIYKSSFQFNFTRGFRNNISYVFISKSIFIFQGPSDFVPNLFSYLPFGETPKTKDTEAKQKQNFLTFFGRGVNNSHQFRLMAFMANEADMKMIGSLAGESLSGALINHLTKVA
jgi:hypothetical protein